MQKLLLTSLFVIFSCVFCFAQESQPTPEKKSGVGSGQGGGSGEANFSTPAKPVKTEPLRILSKPRANYTNAARINEVEGTIRVRITFLSTGEIGSVTPVSGLPYGLTEEAIAAARRIKFQPATRDGLSVSVTKIVEYSFSMFYHEDDPELKKNAAILKMPAPEHPQKSDLRKIGGTVKVRVVFDADETLRVLEVSTDLPEEFAKAAREAAFKIKFDAAVHKNGNAVAQSKVIEYEFKPQND
jgi:TonB family protein